MANIVKNNELFKNEGFYSRDTKTFTVGSISRYLQDVATYLDNAADDHITEAGRTLVYFMGVLFNSSVTGEGPEYPHLDVTTFCVFPLDGIDVYHVLW